MNKHTAQQALLFISKLHEGKGYKDLSKADLFEELKRARHAAKCALAEGSEQNA